MYCSSTAVSAVDYLYLSSFHAGTVRIWHSSTYRLETTLNYGLERMWYICCLRGSNDVALGYDEGSVVIKVIAACNLVKPLCSRYESCDSLACSY